MGLETENPKLFLEQAKAELENYHGIQERLQESLAKEKDAKQAFEKDRAAVTEKIEKTIKDRQKELEQSYDQKISQSSGKIKKAQSERDAAKNKGIKERIADESAPLKQENIELKRQMQGICKREGAPLFIASKFFAVLYKPVSFVEVLILILLFLLIFAALPLGLYFFLLKSKGILFLAGIYLLDILLFGGLYVFVGNRTVGKYREVVKQSIAIRKRILRNKKSIKALAREIRKDSDEGHYNLTEYDDELACLTQERNDFIAQKQNALHNFETVSQEIIRDEIENAEREGLEALKAEWQRNTEERISLEAAERETTLKLSKEFEQYIGKKHMNVEDLQAMIQILEEGKAQSLTETILKLEEGDKTL